MRPSLQTGDHLGTRLMLQPYCIATSMERHCLRPISPEIKKCREKHFINGEGANVRCGAFFIFFGFCHLAVLDSLFSMQRQLNERPDALCCAELHQKSSAGIPIFLYSNVDNPTLTCNRSWNHSKKKQTRLRIHSKNCRWGVWNVPQSFG